MQQIENKKLKITTLERKNKYDCDLGTVKEF